MSTLVRHIVGFFIVALALTAVCQAPAILAMRAGEQPAGIALPLMVIGACGPSLVAIAFAALLEGRAGLRALFRRGARTTKRFRFGLVALVHPFAAHMIGSAVLLMIGQYTATHLGYPPLLPEQVAIAILAPVGEEYGWRGYALPRLQALMTPVTASAIIGVVWAAWHLPTMFTPGASPSTLVVFVPLMIAGSVIYTWLFNATGGSMLVIVLAHLGIHVDNVSRAEVMGDGLAPLVATTAVFVAFALALIATGRLRASTPITHVPVAAPAR